MRESEGEVGSDDFGGQCCLDGIDLVQEVEERILGFKTTVEVGHE